MFSGRWWWRRSGRPPELIQSGLRLRWTGGAKRLTERPRPIDSNKGKFGHVLVVGGSYGTAGAPSMASLACLRAGAGLVTAAVPRELVGLVGAIAPELMVRGLAQGPEGSVLAAADGGRGARRVAAGHQGGGRGAGPFDAR